MSKWKKITVALSVGIMMLTLAGCGGAKQEATKPVDKKIVLGFSQIGAESEWRTANTESIKSAAQAAGIELKFSDAQQKQENQIKAIRSFIQQKVDVIAFSPVVETGWDAVLQEAKQLKYLLFYLTEQLRWAVAMPKIFMLPLWVLILLKRDGKQANG